MFLSWVPKTVSNSIFVCLTSFFGFLVVFIVFFNELFRIDKKHIVQSAILSVILYTYNIFLLNGSKGVEATTISCVVSAYFIFVPFCELIMLKKKLKITTFVSIIIVLIGLFVMLDCKISSLLNVNILFLILADICFAIYIVFVGKYANVSNPSILAMGQLFFYFIIALVVWVIDIVINQNIVIIPKEPAFWGSVIFISLFIRAFYSVIQIYAQRFVSPLETSLIFSSEIVITVLVSPFITKVFEINEIGNKFTIYHIIGAIVMVIGIIISDFSIMEKIRRH